MVPVMNTTDRFDKDENRIEIGKKFAEARKAAGLNQKDVADMACITKANVCKIENGKYNVSIDILCKALASFGYEMVFQPIKEEDEETIRKQMREQLDRLDEMARKNKTSEEEMIEKNLM